MANAQPKVPEVIVTLAEANGYDDEQVATLVSLTDEQLTAFVTLTALPVNAHAARYAETLNAQPKVFRGWIRQSLKLSVSGHAAGCDHQVPTFGDYVAMVRKYVKTNA